MSYQKERKLLSLSISFFCLMVSVFATTAANPHESSYACYYDSKRHTYLGDVYSVKWMEDSDKVHYIASPTGCNSKHGDHKSTKLKEN